MPRADRVELPVAIGQVIGGRYAVTGLLGQGGMGVVLAGKHRELGERVAIKFLHKEHAGHADRFFREARAAARIRSEHVVRIFDVGRLTTGEPYIVMEHLEGEDLADRLQRSGALAIGQAAEHVLDVCKALAEAHAAGVVHRDLKPANIFLARGPGGDELVKLLDFGVAKVPEAGALTRTATVLGSPVYMSPEQLMASREVDARSDIWSLGVVLYELLTANLPFEGSSLVELGILVREKPTPSVRAIVADLPEGIDAVVAKCLAKDRTQRFSDVSELAEALAPFVSPGAAHAIPKIRRVLAEAKRGAELASTLPPPSDDPDGEEEAIPGSGRVPTLETVASRPAASRPGPLAESLVAVSTGSGKAEQAITGPSRRKGRRALLVTAGLGLGAVIVFGVLAKVVGTSAPATAPTGIVSAGPQGGEASLASAPPEPPLPATAPSVTQLLPLVSAPATSSPAPSASNVAPPAVAKPMRPATARPVASPPSPAVTSAPTANCNPPYTIDENGVRRAKRECL